MHRSDAPILVIGGGIVGASAAYHLARAGHRVTVLERGDIAGGVTGSSFAWLGFAKSPATSTSSGLRRRAAAAFSRLETELAYPIGLRRGGALTWEATAAETRAFVAAHREAGHPIELLSKDEIRQVEPGLREPPAVAAHAPDDAGVDPVALTRALLRAAVDRGATVRTGTPVRSLHTEDGIVRGAVTADGVVRGSTVVLAAGTGVDALLAPLGSGGPLSVGGASARVDASPCCLLRFATATPLVSGIVSSPDFELRQLDDRTLIAAEDVPQVGFDGDARRLAHPTLAAIRRLLVGGENVALIDAVVADRPVPADGAPLLGFVTGVPGLYLASAHPGIILAAALGAQIAEEITAASAPGGVGAD